MYLFQKAKKKQKAEAAEGKATTTDEGKFSNFPCTKEE